MISLEAMDLHHQNMMTRTTVRPPFPTLFLVLALVLVLDLALALWWSVPSNHSATESW